ncbi:ParA family protein [Adhaeribacter aquaticus]|uniref:ParA family protein n=1 Tax=Adhaeribacter aquaticus TaxID=299567 RepID=UPI0003F6EFE5|nr:ParA family protein [Adhaeribacter aquaticus]
MSKIFTIAQNKGGVGKSTTTAYLGSALSRLNKTVLLVDLDAQSNLTGCFSSIIYNQDENQGETKPVHIGKVLTGEANIGDVVRKINDNLFIIPSGKDLLQYEEAISNKARREDILKKKIKTIADEYDYILIDTPPHLGLTTNNALYASDFYLIPMQTESFSFDGIDTLIGHANSVAEDTGLRLGGTILTRYNEKKKGKALQAIANAIKNDEEFKTFKTYIRENSKIYEAQLKHKDLFVYAPDSNAAEDYNNLATEFIERYG